MRKEPWVYDFDDMLHDTKLFFLWYSSVIRVVHIQRESGKNIRLGKVAQVTWALWAANLALIQRQCAIILQLAACVYDGKIQQTQTSVVTSLIFR